MVPHVTHKEADAEVDIARDVRAKPVDFRTGMKS